MVENALSPGYRALRENAASVDLSGRGRLRITGEDRARLLHAMTTNQVQKLAPGQGCYVFFLNAQGRILGDANLFCFGDHFLLDTEPETRVKLAEHLDRYIIADDVTVEDVTESTFCIAVEGPQAVTAIPGIHPPSDPYTWTAWGSCFVAATNTTGAGGYAIFGPAHKKSSVLEALSQLPAATAQDALTVRIENGRPRYGEEITERYLVQETGQMHAVNFTKGCYLGQEIVERVRSRAQIHRILCRVEIDSREVPPSGTKLKSGDVEVAEIASAAYSPALGKVIAMAYVRIPHNEPGAEMNWNGAPARVAAQKSPALTP